MPLPRLGSIDAILPQHIDSTMMSAFRNCPQKFALEFLYGLRPPGLSIDLHAGACFASALEEVYKQIHVAKRPLTDALTFAHARFMTEWGDFQIPDWKKTPKTKDRVWAALVGGGDDENMGYLEAYPPLTDEVQPFFDSNGKPTLEYTFAIPLEPAIDPHTPYDNPHTFPLHPNGSPFVYSGRFDMLGIRHGRPVVRDEKTGQSMGREWAEKWDLRSQFIGYTWACRECGIDLDTVVVRGIGILKEKFHQLEAVKTYSDFMRFRWLEQLRRDLWRLRRSWDEGYFDFNLGDACTQYGLCMFRDMCQSADPTPWASTYEVRRWNPLNKNPIAGAQSTEAMAQTAY